MPYPRCIFSLSNVIYLTRRQKWWDKVVIRRRACQSCKFAVGKRDKVAAASSSSPPHPTDLPSREEKRTEPVRPVVKDITNGIASCAESIFEWDALPRDIRHAYHCYAVDEWWSLNKLKIELPRSLLSICFTILLLHRENKLKILGTET